MDGKVIFRKIRGRIIPIIQKHPTTSGFVMLTGAVMAASKIRTKTVEQFRGKGKGSLGALSNLVADVGISAGLIHGAQKLGGGPVTRSFEAVLRVLKKSF